MHRDGLGTLLLLLVLTGMTDVRRDEQLLFLFLLIFLMGDGFRF